MNRDKTMNRMKYYYQSTTGKIPSDETIKFWESLDDYHYIKVYRAWQTLYTSLIFTDMPWNRA